MWLAYIVIVIYSIIKYRMTGLYLYDYIVIVSHILMTETFFKFDVVSC